MAKIAKKNGLGGKARTAGAAAAGAGGRPLPALTPRRFAAALAKAPSGIRSLLRRRGIRTWEALRKLDIIHDAKLNALPGVGRVRLEQLDAWRRETAFPKGPVPCGDYGSFDGWLDAVANGLMAEAKLPMGDFKFRIFKMKTGLLPECERIETLPTLQDAGVAFGRTRERMRQIVNEFLTGENAQYFSGFPANRVRFSELLDIAEKAFGRDDVLTFGEFRRRFAGKSPWPEECARRAGRLYELFDDPAGEGALPGFVVRGFAARGKKRYRTFKAVVRRCRRGEADYPNLRDAMAKRGAKGLTEAEYLYFRRKATSGESSSHEFAMLFRAPTSWEVNRRAVIKVLGPAGKAGMSEEEFQAALDKELPGKAPTGRYYVGLPRGLGPDGGAPYVWVCHMGTPRHKGSRYALSSSWKPFSREKARSLELKMAEHLRRHGCTAGVVGAFWKRWREDGTIPADIPSDRVFLGLLKQADAGILRYPPSHSSPVFALPEAELPQFGLLEAQAELYFRDRELRRTRDVCKFAMEVFGMRDYRVAYAAAAKFCCKKQWQARMKKAKGGRGASS